jgi:hypothetical protein
MIEMKIYTGDNEFQKGYAEGWNAAHEAMSGTATVKEWQEILDYFNDVNKTKYRMTPQKRQQLKCRLKIYSVQEIKDAIQKRSQMDWYRESGFATDWESLFRNDERIAKILNRREDKKDNKLIQSIKEDYFKNTGRLPTEEVIKTKLAKYGITG